MTYVSVYVRCLDRVYNRCGWCGAWVPAPNKMCSDNGEMCAGEKDYYCELWHDEEQVRERKHVEFQYEQKKHYQLYGS